MIVEGGPPTDRLESFPGPPTDAAPTAPRATALKRLPDQEIAEDDAPSREQLLGDGLVQLVGILRGDCLREQRPPPGRSGRDPPAPPSKPAAVRRPCDAPPVRFMHLSRQSSRKLRQACLRG